MKKHLPQLNKKAQTAIELAIFGSIVVFVIGSIITTTVSYSHAQNQQLKALRKALLNSYKYSEGLMTSEVLYRPNCYDETSACRYNRSSAGDASRNSASILLVEDKLTVGSGQTASIDRTPFILSAAGSHTRQMMLPIDPNEVESLPMMDVFVNGQHFVFRTADFKMINISADGSDWNWEPDCILRQNGDVEGCAKFYIKAYNNTADDDWCSAASDCPPYQLPMDRRFNLTRDESISYCRPGDVIANVPSGQWTTFSWQWHMIMGFDEATENSFLQYSTGATPSRQGINMDSSKNSVIDVDGDGFNEYITHIYDRFPSGALQQFQVIDYQDGDIDFSQQCENSPPAVGFTQNVSIYTEVKNGTYLRLEEGRLFDADQQAVRSTQRKDQVDLISREFLLTRNTGAFCYDSGAGMTRRPYANGVPNPVEVCCSGSNCGPHGCFSDGNIERTCMECKDVDGNGANCDVDDSPDQWVIYIRSRIKDQRGRKWITDTSADPGVDFEANFGY